MVQVKVISGKIAIDVVRGQTVTYRKGDVFECPADRLTGISSCNLVEIVGNAVQPGNVASEKKAKSS